MKFAKLLSVCLALVMAMSMMTAYATAESARGIPEDHVYGKYEDPVTLTYARSYSVSVKTDPNDPDIKSLDDNIWYNTYERDLGIKLENLWTAESGDYDQKWMMSMVNGDIPDFGIVSAKVYQQLLEADLIMDTTEIFDKYASDLYREYNEAENWVSYNAIKKNGRLYGFPYPGFTAESVDLMYIRKDWLEAVDREVPKTLDELESLMDAFIEAELGGPDTLGMASFAGIRQYVNFIGGVLEGHGAYHNIWLEEDGELVYSNTTQKFKDGLLRLQDWYEKGYVREDFLTLDVNTGGEDVAAGRCGIVYGVYYTPISGGVASSWANDNAEWVVAEIPTVDGSPAVSLGYNSPSIDRSAYFVSKDCENPEAVIHLINFSMELRNNKKPELYEDLRYNVRADGTSVFHHSVVSGTQIAWANLRCYNDCMAALEAGTGENLPATAKTSYEQIIKAMNGDVESKGMNLVFGVDGVYSVIGKMRSEGRNLITAYNTGSTSTMLEKGADLKQNLEAAMYKVIMGEDISVYEEALDTWYKTGGEQITEEVNDWYRSK